MWVLTHLYSFEYPIYVKPKLLSSLTTTSEFFVLTDLVKKFILNHKRLYSLPIIAFEWYIVKILNISPIYK